MNRPTNTKAVSTRDRILASAYRLFKSRGIAQVGVDTIVADSGCAKASLYNNFSSKEELALAFLDQREKLWTHGWLEQQMRQRCSNPAEQLLVIFDLFDGWFRKKDFEGCSFINVLLESEFNSPVHRAAAAHLGNIQAMIRGFAIDAGLDDTSAFAQAWHIIMKGSIISACEGNRMAALVAKRTAQVLIERWPRLAQASTRTVNIK